jgi:hypothetical protein
MASSSDQGPRVYDGSSIVALVLGVASLGSLALSAAAAGLIGTLAIVAALVSRQRLRVDDDLRGSRLSLAGFLLGVITLAIGFGPLLVALVVALG